MDKLFHPINPFPQWAAKLKGVMNNRLQSKMMYETFGWLENSKNMLELL